MMPQVDMPSMSRGGHIDDDFLIDKIFRAAQHHALPGRLQRRFGQSPQNFITPKMPGRSRAHDFGHTADDIDAGSIRLRAYTYEPHLYRPPLKAGRL